VRVPTSSAKRENVFLGVRPVAPLYPHSTLLAETRAAVIWVLAIVILLNELQLHGTFGMQGHRFGTMLAMCEPAAKHKHPHRRG